MFMDQFFMYLDYVQIGKNDVGINYCLLTKYYLRIFLGDFFI